MFCWDNKQYWAKFTKTASDTGFINDMVLFAVTALGTHK